MKKAILFLFTIACLHASAQKTIEDLTKDDKKFWKCWKPVLVTRSSGKPYKQGQGVIAYYPSLRKPQKVAIISFYLYDFGSYEQKSIGNLRAFGWQKTTSISRQLTDEGAKKIANLFYYSWIDEEKKNAKISQNVDIITPEEFTEEQKKVYNNFQENMSKFARAVMQEDNTGTILQSADGYRNLLCGAPGDYKNAESYGLLAKDLGVDAVIIVSNEVSTQKEGTFFKAVGMYMYGPNPVPRQDIKYMGFNGAGRQEGNAYQLIRLEFNGGDGVLFYNIDKKSNEVNFNIKGIEKVYSNMLGGIYYQLVDVEKCGQEK